MVPPRTAVASPAALATPPHELRRRSRHGTEGLGAVVAQQGNEEQRLPPCGPKELRNVHHETSPERNVGAGIVFAPSRVFGNLYEIKACVFYQEPLNFKMSCDHVFFQPKKKPFKHGHVLFVVTRS